MLGRFTASDEGVSRYCSMNSSGRERGARRVVLPMEYLVFDYEMPLGPGDGIDTPPLTDVIRELRQSSTAIPAGPN